MLTLSSFRFRQSVNDNNYGIDVHISAENQVCSPQKGVGLNNPTVIDSVLRC